MSNILPGKDIEVKITRKCEDMIQKCDALLRMEAERDRYRRVAEAALNWVEDTGECHFCGFVYDYEAQQAGPHSDDCPLKDLRHTP